MLLYIDPGTGSMLFTILLGVLSAGFYFFRDLSVKLKFRILGGKNTEDASKEKLPVVIFSDHKRYWNVFEPLCDEFEARKQKVVYMTASEDDPALDAHYEYIEPRYIGSGNKAFAYLNRLNARVVLSTTPSLDVFQWKRSKDVDLYVHIPHAPSDIAMYRMFGIDYYDAVMLSGEYQGEQIRELESLRHLPEKEIEYIGIPYMDEMKKRLDGESKSDSENKTVLVAPSWGDSGLLKKFGASLIDALLETGYKIILRPHPQSYTAEKELIDSLKEKYPESDRLSWNRDNDNFDVLRKSDILISDFSGVIFEYSLVFDKPVLYTAAQYDKAPYDCAWLEKELWTFEVLPKIGKELTVDNIASVGEMIDECLQSPEFSRGRQEARDETWMYPGEGTKRAVDYVQKLYAKSMEEKRAS